MVQGCYTDGMNPQQKLQHAMEYAFAHRPAVGGFPFLAECLRKAGVQKNTWSLPGAQSIYVMDDGVVVQQGTPLVSGVADVASFDETALIAAIRKDQAGQSSFPEFLASVWAAGVVRYEVDFAAHTVSYYGARGEQYVESYPSCEVNYI